MANLDTRPTRAPSPPAREHMDGARVEAKQPLLDSQPGPTAERLPTEDEFPPEYTGIRDINMLALYRPFRAALDRAEEAMTGSRSEEPLVSRDFWQLSAYIDAIQSQRLFHYGYDPDRVPRPANTRDVHYHTTGMGAMQVVFRLSRDEHPEYFHADDRLQELTKKTSGR